MPNAHYKARRLQKNMYLTDLVVLTYTTNRLYLPAPRLAQILEHAGTSGGSAHKAEKREPKAGFSVCKDIRRRS